MAALKLCLGAIALAAAQPVLPPHPRLIATPARIAAIKAEIESDPTAHLLVELLYLHGEWVLTQSPVMPPPPGPSGVLIPVREVRNTFVRNTFALRIAQACPCSV